MNSVKQAEQGAQGAGPAERWEHPENEVVVEVTGCAKEDAHAVFCALHAAFASDRPDTDVPQEAPGPHGPGHTVWISTFNVSEVRAQARPRPLTAPVTLTLQGGYWAADRLREALTHAFRVQVTGTASGDQEKEVTLRLESR